jgi:hypothetical protein
MRACTLWIWLLVDPWIKPDSFGSTDDISVPAGGDAVGVPDLLPKMFRLGHVAESRPAGSLLQQQIVPSVGDTRSG